MTKIIKSQYENEPIKILGDEIPCAVLEDGMRVISRKSLNKTMGIGEGGGSRDLPRFLYHKALEAFIKPDLRSRIINPIKYKPLKGGGEGYGVPADCLDDICQVWIDADNAGVLKLESQKITAQKARILKNAVAKVGWIALVDEATGYQKVRDKEALQKLLSLYIAKEFLPHTKTFIDAFYEEIYRLQGWNYNPKKNKYQVVGKWTLKFVYGCFPPAIVEAIKRKTPKNDKGNYTKRLFQSLTAEVGKPHLDRALGGIIALMKAASTWRGFERSYARAYGDQKDQLELPLGLLDEIEV